MKCSFKASFSILLLLSTLSAWADKPSVFVAPLDGDLSQIQGWQPALGEGLAEMMITELSKTGKFTVLESTALEQLKDEVRLGEEGWVGKDEKVDKGGFAGADFMFRGKVTRFGSKAQNINLGGFIPGSHGDLGVKTSTSDVRIDWRFVDASTRKIVASGQALGKENGLGFNIGVGVSGHGGRIGFGNQEFMNSALGKATVKALDSIIAEVSTLSLPESGRMKSKEAAHEAEMAAKVEALKKMSGTVLAVPAPNVLIVSLGSKDGFKSGDRLKLYETSEIKDDKGNVVFTDEKLVGEITLDSVQEDRSKATYTGQARVTQGWKVKAQ